MKQLSRFLMTLVALLAMTTGAWADELSESFTTNTGATDYTGEHFTISGQKADTDGLWIGNASGGDKTVTISSRNGENITKIEAVLSYVQDWGDTKLATTSGDVTGTYAVGQTITISSVNATTVTLSGPEGEFKLIEFNSWTIYYGDAPTAGTALTPDATRKVWTLDAMPAGNVELQVAYFPGMLTLPAASEGGSISVVGMTDTTLPDGFEKDDKGNLYVESGTQFQVKAVPAEGYRLVSLSDGTNTYEVDADGIATITMPEGDADLTLTATFSDEFDIAFEALNANTIEDGKATVKVDDEAKTLTEGKLTGVKSGQTVTLTAKQGYKFRKVEVKKGEAPATPEGPTLAQTLTTANMTVKVYYTYTDMNNTCEFLSNGDGTYTFQSGTGLVGGNSNKAKALVVENGKLVFKQNFYETLSKLWNQVGFSVTFDTSANTYSIWKGSNETINATFIKVEVNGTQIALTQQ